MLGLLGALASTASGAIQGQANVTGWNETQRTQRRVNSMVDTSPFDRAFSSYTSGAQQQEGPQGQIAAPQQAPQATPMPANYQQFFQQLERIGTDAELFQ